MSRRDYSAASHCWRGHELTGYTDYRGKRVCVVCRRERDRDRKRRAAKARRLAAGAA